MKKILVPIFFIVICYSCHFGYSKNVMSNEINDSLADTITVKNINDMQKVSNAHVLTNRKRLLDTLITILLDGSKYQECKMVPVK